jgi:hypothetical protein
MYVLLISIGPPTANILAAEPADSLSTGSILLQFSKYILPKLTHPFVYFAGGRHLTCFPAKFYKHFLPNPCQLYAQHIVVTKILGRAIGQAVSSWLPTAAARV